MANQRWQSRRDPRPGLRIGDLPVGWQPFARAVLVRRQRQLALFSAVVDDLSAIVSLRRRQILRRLGEDGFDGTGLRPAWDLDEYGDDDTTSYDRVISHTRDDLTASAIGVGPGSRALSRDDVLNEVLRELVEEVGQTAPSLAAVNRELRARGCTGITAHQLESALLRQQRYR